MRNWIHRHVVYALIRIVSSKKKRKRFFQRRDFRFYKLDKKKFSAVGTNDVDVGGPQHIPIQIFVTSDEFKAVKHDGNAMPQ